MPRDWEKREVIADKFQEIQDSYSGDTIADPKTVRKPFKFEGCLYISTGGASGGNSIPYEEAYRLVPRADFPGEVSYYGKGRQGAYGDWAANRRAQPEGFYHGMLVTRGKTEWVLVGPPLVFVPKAGSIGSKQLDLL